MGCCGSKSTAVRDRNDELEAPQGNLSIGAKAESKTSLPAAAAKDERDKSADDFYLPPLEGFESDVQNQKPISGSSNSLDELCGKSKTKVDKGENSSKLSKLFLKREKEPEYDRKVSKSKEDVTNNEGITVEEEDVGIEICPIEHVPESNEPDIDIYPIDRDISCIVSNGITESHMANGLNRKAPTALDSDIGEMVGNGAGTGSKKKKNAKVHKFTNHMEHKEMLLPDELYKQVLLGNVEVCIPNLTKMVRIFTSSTYTDIQLECNALMTKVYPKLKEFCREQGYEFHVVDLRWGVQDAILDDHSSSEISHRELRTCQKLSTGPNFVTFLCQKYGYCPLPSKIASNEFHLLWKSVEDEQDKQLLQEWFRLDDNAIPPEYVLQPISNQFGNLINPTTDKETKNQALKEWWDVYLTLRNALRSAAVKVLTKDESHKYFMSETEQEIREGVFGTSFPNSQAFWFQRSITDMKDHIETDLSVKYTDILEVPKIKCVGKNPSKVLDKSAKEMLISLKEKLPKVLDKNNIISYNVKWTEKGLDPHSSSEHAQYIDKFCQDFFRIMKESICRATNDSKTSNLDQPLFEEMAQHVLFCQQSCYNFSGQHETLNRIKNYISGSSNFPLVLHGRSGCGSTTLIAMATRMTQSWFETEAAVIVRFLGTTRQSTKVCLCLRSIGLQLSRIYGVHSEKVLVGHHDLVTEFLGLLQNASDSRPLIIYLDSLDRFRSYNIAKELSWLPSKLPPNVKIVVSCFTEDQVFASFKNILSDESHFVKVPYLTQECATDMLRSWLVDQNRKLTESQERSVLQQFADNCWTPLFLKLAFSQAVQWKSFSLTDEASGDVSVRRMINSAFKALEIRHGESLVRHALSYITASKSGLSDSEMEDILSCDEEVLDEVFRFWTPAIRRAPPSLWLRLKHSLDPFIAEHVENGIHLTTWAHQQFHDVALERYLLTNDGDLNGVHSKLADFFLGRWTKGSKKGDGKGSMKERYVSPQPLLFSKIQFNFRKVHELPYHLIKAEDFERLKLSALCNFEFLSVKLRATSVLDVIDDFVEALAVKPDEPDLKLVFETLQLSAHALHTFADQLPSQLIGRLSSPRSPSPSIARLLRQAHHPSIPALIPNIPCLARPGGRLAYSLPLLPGSLVLNQDGSRVLSGSYDQLITLWDVQGAKVVKSLDTYKPIGVLEFCLDEQSAVASCQGSLQFWNLAKEKMVWEIPSTDIPAPIAVAGNRDTLVAIVGNLIKFVDLTTGTLTRDYEDETYTHDMVAGQGDAIALANSSGAYVRIYDLKTKEVVLSFPAYGEDSHDVVSDVILTPFSGGQVIVWSQKSCEVRVFDLKFGKCLHVLGADILYPSVTGNGRHMLCTGKENDISIWNLETAVKERSVLKHPPTATITRIASLDLKVVVTLAEDHLARVWDLQQQGTTNINFEDNKEENSIQQLILIKSSVQKQVITKSKTPGPICVWNLSSCQVIRTLKNTNADEALVVDDTRAVIRSGTKLALIDLQEGKLIKHMRSEFPAKTDKVHRHASSLYKRRDLALRLAESPRVSALSKSLKFSDCALAGKTHVLVLSKDRLYLKIASLETGELVTKLKGGQKSIIETVMVSGNGLVAVCSCENAPLIVWDLRERSKRFTLEISGHYPRLTSADISYNGHYLTDVMKLDKTHKSVVTWDLESGKVKHIIGQGMNVWNVSLSSVSMRLVVAGRIGGSESLRVYNLMTGEFLHQLDGHVEPVKGVCLSKDGKRALTYVPLSGRDRTVRLWDLMTGTIVSCFTPDLPVSSCIVTDDGDQVVIVINKSRPIVSLALSHEIGSRELSVDVSNPYFSHPTLHGAVFDMSSELNWDESNDDSDTDV